MFSPEAIHSSRSHDSAAPGRDARQSESGSRSGKDSVHAVPEQKRKVLFLVDTLLSIGGAEGALRKLVQQLPRFGFECSIGAFELNTEPDFIRLFPCPVHNFTIRNVYGPNAFRAAWRLRQLMARHKFDVIHTMFPIADLWGGPICRFGTGAVLVSGRRDMGIVRSAKHDWAYRWLRGQFDQVQAVAEAARRACIERDGLQADRVITVHNGVEIDWIGSVKPLENPRAAFGLERSGLTVIAVAGTVSPVKGIDILLRAAAIVCRQLPETNFLILGSTDNTYVQRIEALAEHNRQLKSLTQTLGIATNVKFAGWTPSVVAALKSSDVFCLPSRTEGLSNALLEAMACGLPTVATAVGGNPEVVVEGETGHLVPTQDPLALATRLLELLGNAETRQAMGLAAQRRIERHFTAEAMAERTANCYRDAMRARSRRQPLASPSTA